MSPFYLKLSMGSNCFEDRTISHSLKGIHNCHPLGLLPHCTKSSLGFLVPAMLVLLLFSVPTILSSTRERSTCSFPLSRILSVLVSVVYMI